VNSRKIDELVARALDDTCGHNVFETARSGNRMIYQCSVCKTSLGVEEEVREQYG